MGIFLNSSVLIAGFFMLYFGAEMLIRGGVNIALNFHVKKLVIGLTLFAFGTSSPEFVVSFLAGLRGSYDVCVGNVVGSNISNIFLVMGIAALIRPIKIHPQVLKIDMPALLGITALFVLFCFTGVITRYMGAVLFVFLAGYVVFQLKNRRETDVLSIPPKPGNVKIVKNFIIVLLGLTVLTAGGHFTVNSAVKIAEALGISKLLIGLTIVAIGTSLPELFASTIASAKKEGDISAGNVIGSCIFNIAFVIGIVSMFFPFSVPKEIVSFDNYYFIFGLILVSLSVYTKKRIGRKTGILLILLYVFYIVFIVNRSMG